MNKRIATTLLVLFSFTVGLLLVEGVAQLLPESMFDQTSVLKGDALLGASVCNPDIKKDFPEEPKPADVFRIAVFGDSHTVSVPNESTYPEVLEKLLNNDDVKGRKRVEVYNGGAPGHSQYQYYLNLNDRVKQYKPDLVIVGFYIGNDFLDLYRNDDRPSLFFDGREFVHKDPEFFKYDDPNKSGFLMSSRIFRLLRTVFRSTIGYQWSRVRVLWTVGRQSGEGIGAAASYLYTITRGYFINQHIFRQSMNQILFFKRFPKEQLVIDRVNRKTVELMKDVTQANGIRLLYVPIPTKLQFEPESDAAVIDQTLALCGFDRNALKVEDDLYESLFSLFSEHNISSIRIKEALVERAKGGILCDETYHIREEAHALIARALYEKVKPMLIDSLAK